MIKSYKLIEAIILANLKGYLNRYIKIIKRYGGPNSSTNSPELLARLNKEFAPEQIEFIMGGRPGGEDISFTYSPGETSIKTSTITLDLAYIGPNQEYLTNPDSPYFLSTVNDEFKSILSHELIHRDQIARNLKNQSREEIEDKNLKSVQKAAKKLKGRNVELTDLVGSSNYEIMAYAYSDAELLVRYEVDREAALKRLSSEMYRTDYRSMGYIGKASRAFGPNSSKFKKYRKYVVQYIEALT